MSVAKFGVLRIVVMPAIAASASVNNRLWFKSEPFASVVSPISIAEVPTESAGGLRNGGCEDTEV